MTIVAVSGSKPIKAIAARQVLKVPATWRLTPTIPSKLYAIGGLPRLWFPQRWAVKGHTSARD